MASHTFLRMKVLTSSEQTHVPAFFMKLAGLGRQTLAPTTLGMAIT